MRWIDDLLNRITMYRLVLYCLTFLVGVAVIFGFTGVLAYSGVTILLSWMVFTGLCWGVNALFAWAFTAPANVESFYITAWILTLIITPGHWELAIAASVIAMASKYLLAIGKKHVFNPAAVAVAITAMVLGQSASWWVGTAVMAPFVLIVGVLIVRKIRRADLVVNFLTVAIILMATVSIMHGAKPLDALRRTILDSPVLFFAFIMLTEPMTTPPTEGLRIAYGTLTGLVFPPFVHIGLVHSTPELALLAGNIFSYLVSPKQKLTLTLQKKSQASPDVWNFFFQPDQKLPFRAGQYLEWTLGHAHPDTRGNRRYFTIASAPTEPHIQMGIKFYDHASSFKKAMLALEPGALISAGQLAGDFTLPPDPNQRLVFIAGGIGVTPYRSMIKYLIDTGERRDIVLFYANKTEGDIVYREIFDQAQPLGVRTIYVTGALTQQRIMEEVSDWQQRMFYISGPHGMIVAFEDALKKLGVPSRRVKTDFFPGFV